MTYDKIGRLLSRSLPLGMTETYTYGSCCNNPISYSDFAGPLFTFEHDPMNRWLLERFRAARRRRTPITA
jgi:hypothetical protein